MKCYDNAESAYYDHLSRCSGTIAFPVPYMICLAFAVSDYNDAVEGCLDTAYECLGLER